MVPLVNDRAKAIARSTAIPRPCPKRSKVLTAMTAPDFLALRKRLRLTQGEAATLFGVDRRSWQNWEAGKRAPVPVMLLALLVERDPDTVLPIMREVIPTPHRAA